MKDGDIKEVGSHNELLKLDGLYAEIYRKASSLLLHIQCEESTIIIQFF